MRLHHRGALRRGYAVGVLYAREATQAVKAHNDVIDAIFAQVDAADTLRRQCTWVGMPLAPAAAPWLSR